VRQGKDVSARSIADEYLGALQSNHNRPERKGDGELLEITTYGEAVWKPPGA